MALPARATRADGHVRSSRDPPTVELEVSDMRLTWRDGTATILAGIVFAVLLAVTQGWAWPLLGDYRAGVVVLAIAGVAMCTVGMQINDAAAFKQPVVILASLLGVLSLVLIVLGLVFATQALFVTLGFTLLTLWILTTLDHALPAVGGRPAHTQG